jgi:hypothetical protein
VRKARAVSAEEGGLLLEEPHRLRQKILEIEQLLLSARAFVRAEQADAGPHEQHALCEIRIPCVAMRGRCPGGDLLHRDQLLLETLEHLERRRHQVIRSLVAGEHRIAQVPHQLSGQDPALGAGKDPEARRHLDQPAVRPEPAKCDRVEGPHRWSGLTDEVFDPLAHLRRRPIGERHHQDRRWRSALGDQPPEAFGDHRGLASTSPRDDPHGAMPDGCSA